MSGSKSNLGTNISSSDLIDAKLEEHQLCGSKQCPGCGHKLEAKPVREYHPSYSCLQSQDFSNSFFRKNKK